MSFMDDEAVAAALSQSCQVCGVRAGFECVHQVTGEPLMDTAGHPVHIRRLEP